jgi:hypothetical protein
MLPFVIPAKPCNLSGEALSEAEGEALALLNFYPVESLDYSTGTAPRTPFG